jgi:hypothetical protein
MRPAYPALVGQFSQAGKEWHQQGEPVDEGYRKPFSVSLLTGVSVPQ